eukprot:COSAG01_NODE_19566_length_1003_cov_1.242257_1_plen_178_part_10
MNVNSAVMGEPSMLEGMLDIAGALSERYNVSKPVRVWNNVDVPVSGAFARDVHLRGPFRLIFTYVILVLVTKLRDATPHQGFARSSIPALLKGGASALSILANVGSHYPCDSSHGGCNGAVPVEFVGDQNATMFRWHDPASDEEILVLYHKAQWDTPAEVPLYMFGTTYGGFTRLDNM